MLRFFPKALDMILAGETQVSLLALIAPKITHRNAELLLESIKNQQRRAVERILSRITLDGRLINREAEIEVRLVLEKFLLTAVASPRCRKL